VQTQAQYCQCRHHGTLPPQLLFKLATAAEHPAGARAACVTSPTQAAAKKKQLWLLQHHLVVMMVVIIL